MLSKETYKNSADELLLCQSGTCKWSYNFIPQQDSKDFYFAFLVLSLFSGGGGFICPLWTPLITILNPPHGLGWESKAWGNGTK